MRSHFAFSAGSIARRGAAMVAAGAAVVLSACGGGGGGAGGSNPSAAKSPTPVPSAGAELHAFGDVHLSTTVEGSAITCSFPSLNGPEILMFVQNADMSLGGYVTVSSTEVFVRVGAGSGATYTERDFAGPGVTSFDAARGAHFDAQLTDTSQPGQHKGTIGTVTSIAGSVSCGNKMPGGGSITITGDSTGGAISGVLTSLLVGCPAGKTFALINGLTHIGSATATVEIGGGGNQVYFASFSTHYASYFFSSSAPGLYTLGNGHVHWNNAVLTQSGVAGAASHTVTVSGDATCGS